MTIAYEITPSPQQNFNPLPPPTSSSLPRCLSPSLLPDPASLPLGLLLLLFLCQCLTAKPTEGYPEVVGCR